MLVFKEILAAYKKGEELATEDSKTRDILQAPVVGELVGVHRIKTVSPSLNETELTKSEASVPVTVHVKDVGDPFFIKVNANEPLTIEASNFTFRFLKVPGHGIFTAKMVELVDHIDA